MNIVEKAGGFAGQLLILPLAARVTANLYADDHWALTCRRPTKERDMVWRNHAGRLPPFTDTIIQLREVTKGVINGSFGNGQQRVRLPEVICYFDGIQNVYTRTLLAQLLVARTEKNCPIQSRVEQEVSQMAVELGFKEGCLRSQSACALPLKEVTGAILSGRLKLPPILTSSD